MCKLNFYKVCFIVTFFLYAGINGLAHASFFVECEGVVQIEKLISLETASPKEEFVGAIVKLQEESFECRGHAKKLDDGGLVRKVKLQTLANENCYEKGDYLRVKYEYGNSMTPEGVKHWKTWKILHKIGH